MRGSLRFQLTIALLLSDDGPLDLAMTGAENQAKTRFFSRNPGRLQPNSCEILPFSALVRSLALGNMMS